MTMYELLKLSGDTFVRAAYEMVLGREADERGLQHYLARLARGYAKTGLLHDLANSPEGRARADFTDLLRIKDADEFLHAAFRRLMGREPDEIGRAHHLRVLGGSGGRLAVLREMQVSDEARCNPAMIFRRELSAVVLEESGSRGWRGWLRRHKHTQQAVRSVQWSLEARADVLTATQTELVHRIELIESRLAMLSVHSVKSTNATSAIISSQPQRLLDIDMAHILQEIQKEAQAPGYLPVPRSDQPKRYDLVADRVRARVRAHALHEIRQVA